MASDTPKRPKTLEEWLKAVELRMTEDRAVIRMANRAGSDEDRRDAAELKDVIARLPAIADKVKNGNPLSAEDVEFARKWMGEVPGHD